MFARLHTRDTETGLDPTHFRMFSSTEGRWMSTDPAKGCGDKPQNLNRYAYAGNNPTNRIDPKGNFYCGSGWGWDWGDPWFQPAPECGDYWPYWWYYYWWVAALEAATSGGGGAPSTCSFLVRPNSLQSPCDDSERTVYFHPQFIEETCTPTSL